MENLGFFFREMKIKMKMEFLAAHFEKVFLILIIIVTDACFVSRWAQTFGLFWARLRHLEEKKTLF
jgi:hypothetical protein